MEIAMAYNFLSARVRLLACTSRSPSLTFGAFASCCAEVNGHERAWGPGSSQSESVPYEHIDKCGHHHFGKGGTGVLHPCFARDGRNTFSRSACTC